MQARSRDQSREVTKAELLKIAPFSKGQLTKLYRAGYLPRPQRRSRPGSNEPVHYWDESVVEQAALLYDLLHWSGADHWIRLPLWLRGYSVDFAPIRQRWLDSIDAYLRAFTQGEADNPLDNITDIVSEWERRWEHTPTRHRPEALQRLGLAAYAEWVEWFWDMVLVADYEADETTFAEVFAMVGAAGSDTQLQGEFAEGFFPWLQTLQEILAIPRLREVIEQAMPDEWEQARLDYATLCQFFQTLFAPLARKNPKWVNVVFFATSGFYLIPVALAMRYRGYGQWIDDAFAWVSEQLADQDTQAWFAEQLAHYRPDEMLAGG